MFNQLTPAAIVGAIGVAARDAARSPEGADAFQRDQLLSAYSATRHLAAELEGYAPELERFLVAVATRLRDAAAQDDDLAAVVSGDAERLAGTRDVAVAGAVIADILERLRDAGAPAARALRGDLQALLRDLAHREVDLLADALR